MTSRYIAATATLVCISFHLLTAGTAQAGPIHEAAKMGDVAQISRLLQADPRLVHSKDTYSSTPLHYAVARGRTEAARLLLAGGADVNADSDSGSPLLRAAYYYEREMVELLTAHGADVNARDPEGETALHKAATHQRVEFAKLLMANGADVNAQTFQSHQTPLGCALAVAICSRDEEAAAGFDAYGAMVHLLLSNGARAREDDLRTYYEWTPLHCAAANGRKEEVERLIASGARVNARERAFKATPLHFAAGLGRNEVVALLLAKRADVNAKDELSKAPLHWAAAFGQQEAAELLLARGAAIDVRGPSRATPLHWAAGAGQTKLAEFLLARGAGVNAKADLGMTPLHVAAWQGHKQVAEVLIARGADVHAQASTVVLVLGKKHRHPFRDFLTGLLEGYLVGRLVGGALPGSVAGPSASPRARSAESLPTVIAPYLLPSPTSDDSGDDGTEVHWTERHINGTTPLHMAAEDGRTQMLQLLIAHGADPNARDSDGQTPLDLATSHEHPEAVALLRTYLKPTTAVEPTP